MRLSALARSSALRRCQAFCLKTDARAWRGLKAVTVQTPEHKLCSGAMGRSGALGIIQRLGEGVESFMIPCSSAFDEPLSEQIEDAMRELYAKNGEPIRADDELVMTIDSSGIITKSATPFHVARDGVRRFGVTLVVTTARAGAELEVVRKVREGLPGQRHGEFPPDALKLNASVFCRSFARSSKRTKKATSTTRTALLITRCPSNLRTNATRSSSRRPRRKQRKPRTTSPSARGPTISTTALLFPRRWCAGLRRPMVFAWTTSRCTRATSEPPVLRSAKCNVLLSQVQSSWRVSLRHRRLRLDQLLRVSPRPARFSI